MTPFRRAVLGATILAALPAVCARAQLASPSIAPPRQGVAVPSPHLSPLSKSDPVTFTADSVGYDRDRQIVTATGHVEAWQNEHQLRADRVTFNRLTNVAAASGHVQLIEPDGQVVFADYAELTGGMRDGVMRGMRALLAANGRLAANGARRTGGQINEMAKVVYSTCNLCAHNPSAPPLWRLRARSAVQDLTHKRIEYQDAWVDFFGLPVLYLPYFSHADPSVKRASGLLVPSLGSSSHLGQFLAVPYYWAIGPSSDATIVPLLATKAGPQVNVTYRRAFNNGALRINTSAAYDEHTIQGHLYAHGQFNYNDTWRTGFDVNVASGIDYLRNFRIANYAGNVLSTQLYAEGFGQGAYAKLSALSYQGLNSTVTNSQLPFVLPRYQYDYFGLRDAWGGRLSVDTDDFNVVRRLGANDQRGGFSAQWVRPGIGAAGDVWSVTARLDALAYNGFDLNQQPDYAPVNNATTARAQPTLALKMSWPFVRLSPTGSLLIEPIAQIVASPNTGSSGYRQVPNEDSLAPEFTDATLFSLNRFNGIDRQEGGLRANIGLHGSWTNIAGNFDGLVGQSYRLHTDDTFPAYVGLNDHFSDIVGRVAWTPSGWLDLTARTRVDHKNFDVRFAEAVGSIGKPWLRLSSGYIFTTNTPYFLDFRPAQGNPAQPRNELQVSASSRVGRWRVSGYARRDLQDSRMVDTGAEGAYEDECFILDLKFDRRYTSINNDHGDSTVLFQITLKTVGEFGFHAF